jgi:hypothetical protein
MCKFRNKGLRTFEDIDTFLNKKRQAEKEEKTKDQEDSIKDVNECGFQGRTTRLIKNSVKDTMDKNEKEMIQKLNLTYNEFKEIKEKISQNLNNKSINF